MTFDMIKAIGIGNRLMMDDGVAIAVLEHISEKLESMGIKVVIGETDFLFCFRQLEEEDFVIVLDAAYTGAAPGSIHICRLQEALAAYRESDSQHDMSLLEFMKLYAKSLQGCFIGIETAEVKFGYELSETIKSKFNSICLEIEMIMFEIVKDLKHKILFRINGI